MAFIFFTLAVSTVFAAICYFASSQGRRPGRAAIVALIAFLPAVISLSVPWFLQVSTTLVFTFFVWLLGFRADARRSASR